MAGGSNAREKRAAQLAELRRLKQKGQKRGRVYQERENEDVYDEVDADGYRKLVRQRLDENDFVVDDNGQGYVDYGQGDFDNPSADEYDSDYERQTTKASSSTSCAVGSGQQEPSLRQFLQSRKVTAPVAKRQAERVQPLNEKDDSFMNELLGEISADSAPNVLTPNAGKKRNQSAGRRKDSKFSEIDSPVAHQNIAKRELETDLPPSSPPKELTTNDINHSATLSVADEENDELPVQELEPTREIELEQSSTSLSRASSQVKQEEPNHQVKQVELDQPTFEPLPSSEIGIENASWNELNERLHIHEQDEPPTSDFDDQRQSSGFSGIKIPPDICMEEDGSLKFYWIDFVEIGSSLFLFGKVFDRKSEQYVSAFLKIGGLMRKLYFLPRKTKVTDGETTKNEVEMQDVYAEISDLFQKLGIRQWKSKVCTRKYAFELPDVPDQAEYLKVLCSYSDQHIPSDLSGKTYSRIFGTNTSMLEQFVLAKNIMGPRWLLIKDPSFAIQHASWCRLELSIDDIDQIDLDERTKESDSAPLNILSLSMRTVVNSKNNSQEIVMVSYRSFKNVRLDDATPVEKMPNSSFSIIRPYDKVFPMGFEAEAKNRSNRIKCDRSESALLQSLMTRIQNIDPDIIIGHRWDEVDYSILISRMRHCNIQNWHRIGRMKRTSWPKTVGGRSQQFAEKLLQAGRLACDIGNEFGRSLVKAQSWSLNELVDLQLGQSRVDIDSERALNTWASKGKGLLDFISHCEVDTFYIAAIAFKTQILPLSRNLTNIAGNSWSHTLSGTRSERNEYILLHEFNRNKYICPDKQTSKAKQIVLNEDEEVGEAVPGKKKDKYKGGLVFEPEKGLYDKYVLVMDFNSLYPSIIQEFNICFTTVERCSEAEDEVPTVPEPDQPMGIFPRLIATLVNRRRQVKNLIKNPKATAMQKMQWDIKQQALKLTANSMYGCLGFSKSRFYARPLAMLTTFKGREILLHTKELAESLSLQVVYGDTDSLMINTNIVEYEHALKIGREFKAKVNERYSLLEIDIDYIFRKLLLYAKKKYAALVINGLDGKMTTKMDVKGLDMKRREYCALSKEVSSFALKEMLSEDPTDLVVEKLHDYLRELSRNIKANKISIPKFTIFNALGKRPADYPNGKTMPHVQVALKRIARGETIRVHDVIPYIVTGNSSMGHVADRSYPPKEVMKPESKLTVDYDYYLSNQILPPLERLTTHIEGTSRPRLADCLGLDARKYQNNAAFTHQFDRYEGQISEEERFSIANPFKFKFNGVESEYPGANCRTLNPSGFIDSDGNQIPLWWMCVQVNQAIRAHIKKYYNGITVCDDSACSQRTKNINMYGHRCSRPGCRGRVNYEYGERELYTQLQYYEHLFDCDKWKAKAKTPDEAILCENNRNHLNCVQKVVHRHLKKSGWKYVDLGDLFGAMNIA